MWLHDHAMLAEFCDKPIAYLRLSWWWPLPGLQLSEMGVLLVQAPGVELVSPSQLQLEPSLT
jgi:hypothetical protein